MEDIKPEDVNATVIQDQVDGDQRPCSDVLKDWTNNNKDKSESPSEN